jgi:hypothetical protein
LSPFRQPAKSPWFPITSETSHFERIWIQEKEWIAMATAAQIEANRRNSQKSCGPRTQAGMDKSRFNALDHGCRAKILVLPTEEFGDYENQCEAWKLSFRPRNPAEEFLIEGIVSLGCLTRMARG